MVLSMELEIDYQDFVNTYKRGYKTALFYPKVLKFKKRNLSVSEIEKKIKIKCQNHSLFLDEL
jgi:hypothetical protein